MLKESANKQAKRQVVENFFGIVKGKSLVVLNNNCLSSNEINLLRKNAREKGISISVVKNKLAAIALKECQVPEEFIKSLKQKNIFIICDDSIDGMGLTKCLTAANFKPLGQYENNNFTLDANLLKSFAKFSNVKAVLGNSLGCLQEPLMQLKKLLEVISEKESPSSES